MKIIHLDSSVLGTNSVSRMLSSEIVLALKTESPGAEVVYHDLAAEPAMHLSAAHFAAFQGAEVSDPALAADLARGAAYLNELLTADAIVIGAPMYNYSVPSQLRAWIDRVVVAGQTFRYTETGYIALVPAGKRAIIASTRGNYYTPGNPAAPMDFQETYLKAVLSHIGISYVDVIRADGLGIGPEARDRAIEDARSEILALTGSLRAAA